MPKFLTNYIIRKSEIGNQESEGCEIIVMPDIQKSPDRNIGANQL